MICNHVLGAYGMSFDDIVSWGGKVVHTEGMPNGPDRLGAVERGELDAVWDEALPRFAARQSSSACASWRSTNPSSRRSRRTA